MLTLWIVVIAIGALVLFETVLLMFLLRALGEIRQNGNLSTNNAQSPETWGLAVGEKAPSFVATDYEGKPVRLDDFQGQRRILAFVSPGCSACDVALESLTVEYVCLCPSPACGSNKAGTKITYLGGCVTSPCQCPVDYASGGYCCSSGDPCWCS